MPAIIETPLTQPYPPNTHTHPHQKKIITNKKVQFRRFTVENYIHFRTVEEKSSKASIKRKIQVTDSKLNTTLKIDIVNYLKTSISPNDLHFYVI